MNILSDAVLPALQTLLTFDHFMFLCLGIAMGLILGILPGLGSIAGLSLLLPFAFGMEPSMALAMMIGLIAPQHTSDTLPAVLMGIPGSSAAQATVLDGFALSRQGQAARALSAAFLSSLCGGLIGAAVLSVAVFAAKPIVLAMGFPELMMLVIWALSMVGMLTGRSWVKGLAACSIGLLLGTIGGAPASGEPRYTLGILYLFDGLSLVTVALAVFAIPEIIDLLRKNSTISERQTLGQGWLQGVKDTIRHRWIIVRCSILGCIVGILPGIGASVVDWLAYGHVMQTSRDRENFGKGDIRGVIAPESANNATAGGSLVPTLLFGVPGSGSMAVPLGGFIIIGITPGPEMLGKNLHLTFTIIWSLALANVIGAGACFLLAKPFSRLTTIRYTLIGPVMTVLIFFGAYQTTKSYSDLIALLAIGLFAVYMRRFGWPRPALIVGFVLSGQLEASVYRAVQIYGFDFFSRPIVLMLLALTVLTIAVTLYTKRPDTESGVDYTAIRDGLAVRLPQIAFTLLLVAFATFIAVRASEYSYLARIFPLSVSLFALALCGATLVGQFRASPGSPLLADSELAETSEHGPYYFLAWMIGFLLLIGLLGFVIASAVFVFGFTTIYAGRPVWRNAVIAGGVVAVLFSVSYWLGADHASGAIQWVVTLPWWM